MTNKEFKNSLWQTKVYVAGKSREIQEVLFRLGYKWASGDREIRYVDKPYIYIHDGFIVSGSCMEEFYADKRTEITADYILDFQPKEDDKPILLPFDIREAKQPNMKFMTRDGRDVRIICWNALTEDSEPVIGTNNEQPIVALVMDKKEGVEEIITYNEFGTRGHGIDFCDWDILMYVDSANGTKTQYEPKLYKAKRSHDKVEVVGQLLWIEGKAHIIRECDIEEDGHHFRQSSDEPTWVDNETIEEIK